MYIKVYYNNMNKKLPYDIISNIYSYDDTYKNFFLENILIDLKYKIYNIRFYIHSETKNILILYKNQIFIHCDNLEKPNFVSTCIFNNKFPIFENNDEIKNYPEFILVKNPNDEQKNKIIQFIENKYSKTFHPFIEIFF